jgi:uncharacterized membrane protein YagU involved in acid resistance
MIELLALPRTLFLFGVELPSVERQVVLILGFSIVIYARVAAVIYKVMTAHKSRIKIGPSVLYGVSNRSKNSSRSVGLSHLDTPLGMVTKG